MVIDVRSEQAKSITAYRESMAEQLRPLANQREMEAEIEKLCTMIPIGRIAHSKRKVEVECK